MKSLIDKIKRKKQDQIFFEISQIKNEIDTVCEQIKKTDIWFENEQNEDLIDACLYQKKFLKARYRYLLNKIKDLHKIKVQKELDNDTI